MFVCTVSLTLVSDPTSRRFIRWLLFEMFIYIYIEREREREKLFVWCGISIYKCLHRREGLSYYFKKRKLFRNGGYIRDW